ncbi:MAG: ABC transporter permease, partial [Pedobacter sp.]
LLWEHITLTILATSLSIIIGLPLGLLISKYDFLSSPILSIAGVIQTFPSLAILGFMIPIFGIGKAPAIAALFLYGLLPIIRNTYTGISSIDPSLKEAGKGMGMTPLQIMFMLELPLSVKIIMAGIRTAMVINIGTATLAAFIGAGGLGELIVTGLSLNDNSTILWGAIPAALLALVVDFLLAVHSVCKLL